MGLTEAQLSYGQKIADGINAVDQKVGMENRPKSQPFYKAWPAELLRGLVEGSLNLTSIFYEPEPDEPPETYYEARRNISKGLQENLPLNPPEERGLAEKAIERGGKLLPTAALGGGGVLQTILSSALGAAAGQGAEELGAGNLGQAAAEIAGMSLPSISSVFKGGFTPVTAEEEALAEFGRRAGLTEKDITLSSGKRGIIRDFSEQVAHKGKTVEKAFEGASKRIGDAWENLRASPEFSSELGAKASEELVADISNRMSRFPAEIRNAVGEDLQDLLKSKMTGSDVIDFWQKINYHITKGKGIAGTLKKDLTKALKTISPEAAEDFQLLNKLYGNFKGQVLRMSPDMADKLLNFGEAGLLVKGVMTRDLGIMKQLLGAVLGRKLAQQIVINPKLQNLTSKLNSAVMKSSPQSVAKIYNQLVTEIGKENAEAARIMSQMEIGDFYDLLRE